MIKMEQNNNVFLLITTENGNGYTNEECQKIVTIGNEKNSIKNIFNILFLLDRNNTRNKKLLQFNIIDYDLTILNINYLGQHDVLTNYKKTNILSIDANSESEVSQIMINVFELMQNNDNIMQILYTRRKKYNGIKKMFFFLIKIFININIDIPNIKKLLNSNIILNKDIKLKVDDINIDKQNKSEQGIKKNNWKTI
jgi:hypothetical protein